MAAHMHRHVITVLAPQIKMSVRDLIDETLV